MKVAAWYVLKGYGELCWRLNGRRSSRGYYWAVRAMCNWTGFDWYGVPTGPVFTRVWL
jgi:hypothetical protein